MKYQIVRSLAVLALVAGCWSGSAIVYVNVNGTNATPPYASWDTAATRIQDAIDVAGPGDSVLVTNGIYATGSRLGFGSVGNRVAVTKPLVVQSINGPAVTIIQGGPNLVRCAYLTNGAWLVGFTLTQGKTSDTGDQFQERSGGGVWCERSAVVSNCVLAGNWAGWGGGGAYQGVLSNCTITGNSARAYGGGAYGATLSSCTLTGNQAAGGPGGPVVMLPSGGGAFASALNTCTISSNSATDGGGVSSSTLTDCTLMRNSAQTGGGADTSTLEDCALAANTALYGGGSSGCTLNHCTLTGNTSYAASGSWGGGGGANGGTLNGCIIMGNSAYAGGGVRGATLNNCTIASNSASVYGGGTWFCTHNNCTVIANAAIIGGGAFEGVLNNSIVYYNLASGGPNWANATLSFCCTTPLPDSGLGNIEADPQLIDSSHLSAASPCRGAGDATYASGTDIDGEPWANPPSIGCDEFNPAARTGPISLSIRADYTNITAGFSASLTAVIDGQATASFWDFGDGTVVSNRLHASHAWSVPGIYVVVLRAYNDSNPTGITAALGVKVAGPAVYCVNANNPAPVAPYDSWGKAAATLQDAIDVALPGATVLATNGNYDSGGRIVSDGLMDRVAVTKPLVVRSVNGPAMTVIRGYQIPGINNGDGAVRCVYLTNGAMLVGFTLTGGATKTNGDPLKAQDGGGIWCEATAVVSNCVITGNSAVDGGGACSGTLLNCAITTNSAASTGGGVTWSILKNCKLTGNSAGAYGGGAASSSLLNCTIAGNSAVWDGGGACFGSLSNCVLTDNSAQRGPNWEDVTLDYCCSTPLPGGVENFTNAPFLADCAAGDLRLQSNSPCINAGFNAYGAGPTDLAGNPRIVGGTIDIGAYEFQNPASTISYAWLQQFGLPADATTDYADPDGDGMNNWQEWRAGTDPTNALSAIEMLSPSSSSSGLIVSWRSVTGRTYFLQRSLDLSASPAFLTLRSNIAGQAGLTTFTDTNPPGNGPLFYRVGVQ